MKKLIAIAVATVFVAVVGVTAAISMDAPAALKVTNFGKKDAVTFDHASHAEAACIACHHEDKIVEGDAATYKCGACHTDTKAMKAAAHKKEEGKCWTCHNKKSPSVVKALKCKDCHKG